jgi:hypothetical protein
MIAAWDIRWFRFAAPDKRRPLLGLRAFGSARVDVLSVANSDAHVHSA